VRLASAAVLLALLAGCGGGKEPDAVTEAYGIWKRRNFILGQTFSGGATLDGTIYITLGVHRGDKGDWVELAVNGNTIARTTESNKQPSESVEELVVKYDVRLRPGPNWIRFFSSAARLGWEFQVDSNYGTNFEFTPKDKQEYDMVQRKNE